jgi:copper resistance protein C
VAVAAVASAAMATLPGAVAAPALASAARTATLASAARAPARAPAASAPALLAHAVLVATEPTATAELPTPPDRIAVQFAAPVLDLGAELKISADGEVLAEGAAAVRGSTISRGLSGDLPAGGYQVLWRATSIDGHVLSGAFDFSVAAAGSVLGEPELEPGAAGAGPAATTVAPDRIPTAPRSIGQQIGSGGTLQWVLAAMVAAGAALAVIGSRRRATRIRDEPL